MGFWGHNTFANDTALDWVGDLWDKELEPKIRAAVVGENKEEFRAATALLVNLAKFADSAFVVDASFQELVRLSHDRLQDLYKDKAYIDSWAESAVLQYILGEEFVAIGSVLDELPNLEELEASFPLVGKV